jgi:hypothetical protein
MFNLKQHGGHVLPEDVPGARDLAATVGVFLAKVGVFLRIPLWPHHGAGSV